MLPRSFIHLPGIGRRTELRLWERGIDSWAALASQASLYFRGPRLSNLLQAVEQSQEAWEKKDLLFFAKRLPRSDQWRVAPGFLEDVAFLDIETTGLYFPPRSESTTICFYFRGEIYQEHEYHLKRLLLERMMDEAALFCSYNGAGFDLPFLRQEFLFGLDKPHVDLCPWLRRLGFKGGLKRVQAEFPEVPQRNSYDIDGYDAVRLWRLHQQGEAGALETLLSYNAEDTVVLEPLLIKALNLESERRPYLGLPMSEIGPRPPLPTQVDYRVYEMLRR
jgi:uncharacterized protein